MKCPECKHQMHVDDYLTDWQAYDEKLASECSLTDEQIEQGHYDIESEYSRFYYTVGVLVCENCDYDEMDVNGKRYWWNYKDGDFSASKPLTPKEQNALENAAQEAAGQLRLL